MWGQAAMEFRHRVDRVAEMFEGIVRPEHTDLAFAKRPAIIQVGGDPAAVQVDRLVTGGRVDPAAQVDLPQAILITPSFDQRIDVLIVHASVSVWMKLFCSPRQVLPAWTW